MSQQDTQLDARSYDTVQLWSRPAAWPVSRDAWQDNVVAFGVGGLEPSAECVTFNYSIDTPLSPGAALYGESGAGPGGRRDNVKPFEPRRRSYGYSI
jgi:hypothetical protein